MSNVIETLGVAVKKSAKILATAPTKQINDVLNTTSRLLLEAEGELISANDADIVAARKAGRDDAFIDRLRLSRNRIQAISDSVKVVAELPDQVGEIISETERPNGLLIQKVRVPIGVIGMIYESRPNVTIDAACLCLKSHNAVILRGGSEAFETNKMLHSLIVKALKEHKLPQETVTFVDSTDRALVKDILNAVGVIDVLIPRGGKSLTDRVMNEAKMPVFAHLDGICHVYVDASAKADIARAVVVNSKMRRPGICGAAETLLLDAALPAPQKKDLLNQLIKAGCTIRGDETLLNLDSRIEPANDEDWTTEYLAPTISAKIVDGVEEAIAHINTYGSHHTDSILAEDPDAVARFLEGVDSGIVMHNASTQFADGGEFGMGAEIGISTGKLHARGPVALEQLTTYKYYVLGTGQIRD